MQKTKVFRQTLSLGDFELAFGVSCDFKGVSRSEGGCGNCATPSSQKCYTGIRTFWH